MDLDNDWSEQSKYCITLAIENKIENSRFFFFHLYIFGRHK